MNRFLAPALALLLAGPAFAYGDTKPAEGQHESNPFAKPSNNPNTNPFAPPGTPVQSQPASQFQAWNNPYGYRFYLPTSLKLSAQDKQTWEFSSTGFWMRVIGWRDTRWSARDVAYQQYEGWTSTSNKELSVQKDITRLLGKSGAEGYLLEGTGIQNDKIVRFVFVGLHHPVTGNNLNLRFGWWNDPNQNARHEANIERLLANIEAIKPAN